jgi:DNA-binding GntR family transcriptional regulator
MHCADIAEMTPDPLASLKPVDPAFPAAAQIFGQLKAGILTMTLVPGQVLSEPEIGARLGVSRTPVREAFAQLRAIELVTTRPSRGTYVTKLNDAKIREAQYLREALEVATVKRLISDGIPDASQEALAQNLKAQRQAVANTARPAFHKLDDEFHFLLAKATGFPRAAAVLGQEKAQLDRLRVLSLQDDAHFAMLYQDHSRLFDAICQQDKEAAMAIAVPHLRSVLHVLRGYATLHADYFDNTSIE